MQLKSEIGFVNEKLEQSFYSLSQGDNPQRELFKFIKQALANIRENAFCGIQIKKKLIPKEYSKRYGKLNNLWKYDLPGAWRLLYTIKDDKILVVSIILEWLSHKEYEKRFGY